MIAAVAVATMLALVAVPAFAQTAASKSKESSATTSAAKYDLSWTLPTAGKSGCLVCHGDKNLVRLRNGKAVSMYVNYLELQDSAHASVQCTGCHKKSQKEGKKTAPLYCGECHRKR